MVDAAPAAGARDASAFAVVRARADTCALVSIGSPPPRSTTSVERRPSSTVVGKRVVVPRVASEVTAVSSLVVEAPRIGVVECAAYATSPVPASLTSTPGAAPRARAAATRAGRSAAMRVCAAT